MEETALNNSKQPVDAAQCETSPKIRRYTSWGWWAHHELTYRAVDWFLNSSVGVASDFLVKRTVIGQEWIDKPITERFKKLLRPLFTNEKSLNSSAAWGTRLLNIMIGGFTVIPLVMALESKSVKKKIIRWVDEIIHGKEAVANDPKFQESYSEIDKEPKKSFWGGMAARALALAPIFVVAFTPLNKWPEEHVYNPISRKTKQAAEFIGIKPSAKMMLPKPDAEGKLLSDWDYLHQSIGFDFGLTFAYAFLHEIAYKILAAFGVKKEKVKNNTTPTCGAPMQKLSEPVAVEQVEPSAAARLRREKNESYTQAVANGRKGVEAGQLHLA